MQLTDYNDMADLLKILGHPARLCIIDGLLNNTGRNVSFMQGCLNIPQSTVSQHLSKLKAAGIIVGKREGLEIKYTVVSENAIKVLKVLQMDN